MTAWQLSQLVVCVLDSVQLTGYTVDKGSSLADQTHPGAYGYKIEALHAPALKSLTIFLDLQHQLKKMKEKNEILRK
jgi:hypothetical protein